MFQGREADLVRAAKSGDARAFADMLAPEYRAAFRLAYGLLHDGDEAEDAVQEAAFRAWRKLSNLREGSRLRPWFLAIVANESRAIRSRRPRSGPRPEVLERIAAEEVDVATSVDLRRALARLDHDQRLVLVLRYYLDLPIEEIAATLGTTPRAARSRVERAVQRLRPIVQVQEAFS
ncbi:MAG TPA: RNA polymerase sigma factor [Candidatus Dormibacteraeota bacterium]|nr:RNA polymerase sigma factor [Candidatus Dormibacteraeota bacterium]